MSPRPAAVDVREALQAAAQAQRATAAALEALAALVSAGSGQPAAAPAVAPAPADPEALLTVAQAAQRIGMSESWVYRAVEGGRLPSVRMGTRRRVRVADLEAFVRERASRAPAAVVRFPRRAEP